MWYFGQGGGRLLAFGPGSVLSQTEPWECFGGRILSHFPAKPFKRKKIDIASANSPTLHFDSTPTQSPDDTQAR